MSIEMPPPDNPEDPDDAIPTEDQAEAIEEILEEAEEGGLDDDDE